MLNNFRYRITVTNVCNTVQTVMKNTLHLAYNLQNKIDKKIMLKSLPRKDEGTIGEKNANISTFEVYPNSFIDTLVVGGLRFRDLPIINIRTSRNNTIINVTDEKGVPKFIHSCGIEGFKNARKGTNIAAQSTAVTFGRRLIEKGIDTV
ncbi:uncharacterized protein LOC115889537 isoform X2 [Sitophilus oryzae]|nr:uncharacterized protein LOC115889537 isoform X2 [Sitophilus oryzae]